jgi:Na+-driven multidrug efflux pump
LWGVASTVFLAVLAAPLGSMLAHHHTLASKITTAFWILPLGFASYAAVVVTSSVYNAIGRASRTIGFAILRTIVLAVPIGALAERAFGYQGLYAALPLASFITGWYAVRRLRLDSLRSSPTLQIDATLSGAR